MPVRGTGGQGTFGVGQGRRPTVQVGTGQPQVTGTVPGLSSTGGTTGGFTLPTARPVNQPAFQSPFMYSGFRASSNQPAYVGYGAAMFPPPPAAGIPPTTAPPPTYGGPTAALTAPRAGGIANNEIWTGGSTLNPLGRPIALTCFRPKDLRERLKIQEALESGLADVMKLDMPSAAGETESYSITRSIGELKLELERCGLDNPFRIMTSPTTEIYLLENWGGVSLSDVKYWCDQLDNTGCPFDSENLRVSAMKIKGSLGTSLSSRVATVTEADAPGPVLFKVAVDQVASLSAAKVRKLVGDLQGLSLKNVAAQSVPIITQRVTELARQIDFSDVGPGDLTALVAKVYTTGTDTGFNHHAWGVYNSIATMFDRRPWREVVEGFVSFYEQQVQLDLYVPALGKKDSDQTIHGLLSAKLDKLEKRLDQASGPPGGASDKPSPSKGHGGGTDTRCCYKCNAVGHLSKDCPSAKDIDPSHVPPNTKKGEPRERIRNGVTERWCGRCREGKGLWTHGSGDQCHLTENHPKPPEPGGSSNVPSLAPGAGAAEANLGFIDAPFHFGFLAHVFEPVQESLASATSSIASALVYPKDLDGDFSA